ncbi:hypothetical protein VDGL01_07882 [Verticillium dahliae]
MATTEPAPSPHDRSDRPGRRRPFSTWVKKLTTNFKNSSSDGQLRNGSESKRLQGKKGHKKHVSKNNNPYPQSGRVGQGQTNHSSHSFSSTGRSGSATSLERSVRSDDDGPPHTAGGARSLAPTVATDHEAPHSMVAPSQGASSVAGTNRTAGGIDSRRGGDSTFSSPAPSVRSLTTTLTTIQSTMAPNTQTTTSNAGNGHHGGGGGGGSGSGHQGHTQSIQFHQPFPTASPASAIPSHLAPSSTGPGHPTTYNSATANNLLTDDASILTLASSSKRRRRRSFDTDASVRAMAPSSLWGGSRESLPLSVLSANIDHHAAAAAAAAAHQAGSNPRSLQGVGVGVGPERTSIYSTSGVATMLSERNSFYAKQQRDAGDGASTRSGFLGHGRADSISGSIGGVASPLVSPRERAAVEETMEERTAATADVRGKEREDDGR